jgi:hypothetical protein
MFVLWDADGNEIRDEYPQMDPHDILRNPENAVFNLDMIVGRLKEIGNSDIVALHQLAQNHYLVITVPQCPKNSHHYENLSSRLLMRLRRTADTISLGSQEIVFHRPVIA